MTHCPDCRNPISSLMMIDKKNEPEYYCERCARTWPVAAAPAETREPALAGRR
jgi:uncharacterized protein YbaR (Trm112 family)